MEQHTTIDVVAPPETVWEVMTDIDRWPEWSDSVTGARRLDDGPLAVGSRAELVQPKLPRATWTVTALDRGTGFDWEQRGRGVRTTATHRLERLPDGGTRVRLSVEQGGLLGPLVGRLYAGLTDRYLVMEATGLKRRSESRAV